MGSRIMADVGVQEERFTPVYPSIAVFKVGSTFSQRLDLATG
jgi:hypothetical protein